MTLHGISSSSILAGITSAVFIKTGIDISDTGLASLILNQLSQLNNTGIRNTMPLLSIVLGALSIILSVIFVIQIISHGKPGIAVAVFGFIGPLIMLLAPVSSTFVILLGVAMTGLSIYLAKKLD